MAITNRIRNQHLLWRAGFGPMAENAASLDTLSTPDLWNLILKTSSKSPEKIEVADNLADGLYKGVQDIVRMQQESREDEKSRKEVQRRLREKSREDLKNLNVRWLEEMVGSEAQLREKMSLFWHGHFACRVINIFFQQELLHIIRTHALGNFREMLKAVSKSPAMLQFLNNQQNKKAKPNENFAREVMELFTMGRGNYSESDIKEAARAFTGWGFNMKGEFVFRKVFHDNNTKVFLGKSGNFDGDNILDIILEKRATSLFITKKLYRYFVNETPVLTEQEENDIQLLALAFYESNYDLKVLYTGLFTCDSFYNAKNIGSKIKSPVELLAGIRRFLPMTLDNDNAQVLFQRVLGQILFYPPNVAGWQGGKSWIDSSSLMVRMLIPRVLAAKEQLDINPKSDDDVNMGKTTGNMAATRSRLFVEKGGSADIDWGMVTQIFTATSREQLPEKIADILLQTQSRVPVKTILDFADDDSREDFIKSTVVNIMCTPEYQMC